MKNNRYLYMFALIFSYIVLSISCVFGSQDQDVDHAFQEHICLIERYKSFKNQRDPEKIVKILSQSSGERSCDEPDQEFKRPEIRKKNVSNNDMGGNIKNISKKDPRSELGIIVRYAAEKHNVPDSLIRAIIHVESAFNPRAISPKGAQGLMQLLPATASMINVKDSFDPEQNIDGGTGLIRRYLNNYGSLKKCLIAYNAGPLYVEKGGIIPAETRNYIARVFNSYKFYGNCIKRKP